MCLKVNCWNFAYGNLKFLKAPRGREILKARTGVYEWKGLKSFENLENYIFWIFFIKIESS